MKFRLILLTLALCTSMASFAQKNSFYNFSARTSEGKPFPFSSLKGKKVLIVNTASRCGFTPQYKELQALFEQYRGKDFVIVAFPANDFLSQEPGSNAEIRQFCTENYHITFPVMEKISVKGKDMDPIYKWLTSKELNGKFDAKVTWNFQKFMIDEQGNLIDFASPSTKPYDPKIVNWITGKK